jgi:hypothetical protein
MKPRLFPAMLSAMALAVLPSLAQQNQPETPAVTGEKAHPEVGTKAEKKSEPRTEYFTQRADAPEGRGWKIAPQNLPPLGEILAAPGGDRPPYGVYCWVDEYERAAAEVDKMGVKSLRLAGPWADADRAMSMAARSGIEILFTLGTGADKEHYKKNRNDFASDEEFLAAFKTNVAAFVKRYGPGGEFEKTTGLKTPVAVVEMWNEPNFQYMLDELPVRAETEAAREALYPKVLRAGYEASKSIAPELKVAGFGAGGADFGDLRFIKNIFDRNPDIGSFFDILTTHPYNKGAPPEAERVRFWGSYSIANGLAQIRSAIGPSAKKPIWYTELGWHFSRADGGPYDTPKDRLQDDVTPDLHAAYVTRAYLWALRLGVPRVHIMHLHDSDGFNGGFMHRNGFVWRPVAHATKALTSLLPNPKILAALSDGEHNTYAYLLKADHKDPASREVVYAWNTLGPAAFEVEASGDSVAIADMMGNRKRVPVQQGKAKIEIGPYPIYILK